MSLKEEIAEIINGCIGQLEDIRKNSGDLISENLHNNEFDSAIETVEVCKEIDELIGSLTEIFDRFETENKAIISPKKKGRSAKRGKRVAISGKKRGYLTPIKEYEPEIIKFLQRHNGGPIHKSIVQKHIQKAIQLKSEDRETDKRGTPKWCIYLDGAARRLVEKRLLRKNGRSGEWALTHRGQTFDLSTQEV